MKYMKVLVVGYKKYELYGFAFANAFESIGNAEVRFYATDIDNKKNDWVNSLINRFEEHYTIGYYTEAINRGLLDTANNFKPDLVFLYTARNIYAKTIEKIKRMDCCVMLYNNDNPFSNYYPKYYWRHYIKAIKYSDMVWGYRESNIVESQKRGAKNTGLLRSYYLTKRNYYIGYPASPEYVPDVVFLGHYENDKRTEYIRYVVDNGIELGVSGHAYHSYGISNPKLKKLECYGSHYNEELNLTKIALVFLSTLNEDTYTRRCFEIPATKTMMLSEYTDDLASLYEEDKEIVFFRSKEELVEKIRYYLSHDEEREKIAIAGYERLIRDGHEVKDRVRQVIKCYEELIDNS